VFQPRTILHPTDFSAPSAKAFQVAVDLARAYAARLLVLHVAETLGPDNVTFGEAVSQPQPAGYRIRLLEELSRVAPPEDAGVPVEHLLAEGDPATEIERVAQERQCDLIVMGTHGRKGLRRLLMGSIAEQVVRYATCPVLTIRFP
jgi:nucleotide-binding universal stress UspA family protein